MPNKNFKRLTRVIRMIFLFLLVKFGISIYQDLVSISRTSNGNNNCFMFHLIQLMEETGDMGVLVEMGVSIVVCLCKHFTTYECKTNNYLFYFRGWRHRFSRKTCYSVSLLFIFSNMVFFFNIRKI